MASRVTPEQVLREIENLEAFLRVPQAHQLTAQQRQIKLAMLLKDYPETSGTHLSWCVAKWMEEAGSTEFRRFPSWDELLGRLYRQINGSGSRSAGYRDLPDGLRPATWQVETLRFGHGDAPSGAPQLEGSSDPTAKPLPDLEEADRAFFETNPHHPARGLYGPILSRPRKKTGLQPETWREYVEGLDVQALAEPTDAMVVQCQVRLEKQLLAGRTSIAEWNRSIPSASAVLPRVQFLKDHPMFLDPNLCDHGQVLQKAARERAREQARQEAKAAAAHAHARAKALQRQNSPGPFVE
jgi:hypothetical protein